MDATELATVPFELEETAEVLIKTASVLWRPEFRIPFPRGEFCAWMMEHNNKKIGFISIVENSTSGIFHC